MGTIEERCGGAVRGSGTAARGSSSKHERMFIDVAKITARQSNCVRLQVGAVAVKDNRIIAHGYNGTPSGFINCSDHFNKSYFDRDEHRKWSSSFEIHAEMNVIAFAAKHGISLEGAVIYCTHKPCNNCTKHLIQVGVEKVKYINNYPNDEELFKDHIILEEIL